MLFSPYWLVLVTLGTATCSVHDDAVGLRLRLTPRHAHFATPLRSNPPNTSSFGCYFINVTGAGVPATVRREQLGKRPPGCLGLNAVSDGFSLKRLTAGATVPLRIPAGKSRTFQVLGAIPADGGECDGRTLASLFSGSKAPRLFHAGSATVDLYRGSVVPIESDYDPAQKELVAACDQTADGNPDQPASTTDKVYFLLAITTPQRIYAIPRKSDGTLDGTGIVQLDTGGNNPSFFAVSPTNEYFYELDRESEQDYVGYTFSAAGEFSTISGMQTNVTGFILTSGVIDSANKLYVHGKSTLEFESHAINSSAKPDFADPAATSTSPSTPNGLAVNSAGSRLYVMGQNGTSHAVLQYNLSGGAPTFSTSTSIPFHCEKMILAPNQKALYLRGTSEIVSLKVNASGNIAASADTTIDLGPYTNYTTALHLWDITPDSKYVILGSDTNRKFLVIPTDANGSLGTPTEYDLSGSGSSALKAMSIDPFDGKHLYAGDNSVPQKVLRFAISSSTGEPTFVDSLLLNGVTAGGTRSTMIGR